MNESKLVQVVSTAPSAVDYHRATGRVHGVMKRQAISSLVSTAVAARMSRYLSHRIRVSFAIQAASGVETTYLVAEKDSYCGFTIVSAADTTQKVGSVVRIQSNLTSITYALYNHDGMQIATIVYAVPSVSAFVRGDAPPRSAQIALRPTTTTTTTASFSDCPIWFEAACKDSIRTTGSLDAMVQSSAAHSTHSVPLFASVAPYAKGNRRFGLNFRGRGKMASSKNMQVRRHMTSSNKVSVSAASAESPVVVMDNVEHDDSTSVVLQMVKWEADTYHVDFAAPFTVLHAFAFGLAQMDL